MRIGNPDWRTPSTPGWVAPLAVFAALLVAYVIVSPERSASLLVLNLSDATAGVALAALGAGLVILSGGFDLSVGAVLSLVNVVLATRFTHEGQSPAVAVLAGLAVGGLCGLINGLLVTVARIPPIIATLGSSFVLSGLALFVLAEPGGEISSGFSLLLSGSFGQWPRSAVLIVAAIIVWQLLRRARFGQLVYAVGADARSARMAGVRVNGVLLRVYVLAGVFYGLAGAYLTAQTSTGDPRLGDPLTLTVFAAVVVGAVQLGGGRGALAGVVVGALVLSIIRDLLFLTGVNADAFYVVTGLALVAAVALPLIRRRRTSRAVAEPPVAEPPGSGPPGSGPPRAPADPSGVRP
jgi:ribose transport system permease protein